MAGKPLIITCAVIGAEVNKEIYPYFPETTDALADAAADAAAAGASIIHLHVRDIDGNPTQDVATFKEVTEKIRERNKDVIIQYTTGGAAGTPLKLRCEPLTLRPEMATLSMGTLNFGPEIFENTEHIIKTIAADEVKYGVMPELEIFDYGMMEAVPKYVKKGWIPAKHHIDFVLGVPGGMSGTIHNLNMLVNMLPEGQTWCVAGVGRFQLPLTAHAIAMGGHVRVGLEDNMYFTKGVHAKSNAEFVARVARIALEMDRPVATPAETREILGL
ncbi:MAG: 3-keto-5-aminohexanoate cleavage protein [Bacteriovoracaceae bacterium]|nr:3-keto-5-aminohexanoate cleavage protein [Bacteriovoracaceae bacterium]